MNKHSFKETGNRGEQNGYNDASQFGGDYAATQMDRIPQQEKHGSKVMPKGPPINGWVTMLKRAHVEKILRLSRSAIYARMDKNSNAFDASFPTPVRYGNSTSVFWVAAEVYAWLDAQILRTRGSSEGARSQKVGDTA